MTWPRSGSRADLGPAQKISFVPSQQPADHKARPKLFLIANLELFCSRCCSAVCATRSCSQHLPGYAPRPLRGLLSTYTRLVTPFSLSPQTKPLSAPQPDKSCVRHRSFPAPRIPRWSRPFAIASARSPPRRSWASLPMARPRLRSVRVTGSKEPTYGAEQKLTTGFNRDFGPRPGCLHRPGRKQQVGLAPPAEPS